MLIFYFTNSSEVQLIFAQPTGLLEGASPILKMPNGTRLRIFVNVNFVECIFFQARLKYNSKLITI